jgi:hypothetical protein
MRLQLIILHPNMSPEKKMKFTGEASSMYNTLYSKAVKNQVVMIFNLDRSTNDQSPK